MFKLNKILVIGLALFSIVGCNLDVDNSSGNVVDEEKSDGRSYYGKEEEKEVELLKDELSINGIELYDSVDDVELIFGEPSKVTDEPENVYTYKYDEIGTEFVFDGETNKLNAIGVESDQIKTKKGVSVGDNFDDVLSQYIMFDAYFFHTHAIIAQDEDTILSFVLNPDDNVIFYLLTDKKFFEKSTGMTTQDYIEEIRRVSEERNKRESQQFPEIEDELAEEYEEDNEPVYEPDYDTTDESVSETIDSSLETENDQRITGIDYSLYFAIINGNTSEVIKLLNENHFDLNKLFSTSGHPSPYFQTTFIHTAAQYGDLEMVKAMIVHGADINVKDPDGHPVLFIALKQNKTDIAKYLLELGSDPDYLVWDQSERNMSYTYTPLMLAAQHGNIEIMKNLIDRHVDVNQLSLIGETALMFAVQNNQVEAAKWLMAHGADPFIKDNTFDYTIFDYTADEYGLSAEMVEWLNSIR